MPIAGPVCGLLCCFVLPGGPPCACQQQEDRETGILREIQIYEIFPAKIIDLKINTGKERNLLKGKEINLHLTEDTHCLDSWFV